MTYGHQFELPLVPRDQPPFGRRTLTTDKTQASFLLLFPRKYFQLRKKCLLKKETNRIEVSMAP